MDEGCIFAFYKESNFEKVELLIINKKMNANSSSNNTNDTVTDTDIDASQDSTIGQVSNVGIAHPTFFLQQPQDRLVQVDELGHMLRVDRADITVWVFEAPYPNHTYQKLGVRPILIQTPLEDLIEIGEDVVIDPNEYWGFATELPVVHSTVDNHQAFRQFNYAPFHTVCFDREIKVEMDVAL